MADHGDNGRAAVLVNGNNTSPKVLSYALQVVAQFGRVAMRRSYGNHQTLASKWRDTPVRMAFTPCLQHQYAGGKNTSDIALALDAQEAPLARSIGNGKVGLGDLGQYMKPTDPGFAPEGHGHGTLSDMIHCYPELALTQRQGIGSWVSLNPSVELPKEGGK